MLASIWKKLESLCTIKRSMQNDVATIVKTVWKLPKKLS